MTAAPATTPASATTPDPAAVWDAYTKSWQTGSAQTRRALFERSLSPGCVYTDPLTQASGYDELEAYMEEFHRQVPGGHFLTQAFTAHHDRALIRWTMVDGDGQQIGEGSSYGEFGPDGRLTGMSGFFDVPGS